MMTDAETSQKARDIVRVTITLDRGVYERIKGRARLVGTRPSSWISMVLTSKINKVDMEGEFQ